MFKYVIVVMVIVIVGIVFVLVKCVVLVFGNSVYEYIVLLFNFVNDVEVMVIKLCGFGFDVVVGQDQIYNDMCCLVMEFVKKVYGVDIVLLFYVGYGMQVGVKNFFILIDVKIEDEIFFDFEIIFVDFIMCQMLKDVKVQMVFFDVCCDNLLFWMLVCWFGLIRFVNLGIGFVEIRLEEIGGEGFVIVFVMSLGDVVEDGFGSNLLFIFVFICYIDILNVFI